MDDVTERFDEEVAKHGIDAALALIVDELFNVVGDPLTSIMWRLREGEIPPELVDEMEATVESLKTAIEWARMIGRASDILAGRQPLDN